jgi:hypothetical protein
MTGSEMNYGIPSAVEGSAVSAMVRKKERL